MENIDWARALCGRGAYVIHRQALVMGKVVVAHEGIEGPEGPDGTRVDAVVLELDTGDKLLAVPENFIELNAAQALAAVHVGTNLGSFALNAAAHLRRCSLPVDLARDVLAAALAAQLRALGGTEAR